MGMGSLKRIAALSILATVAVCGMGAMSVGAISVPGTTVTVPTTTVQVTTPTVRVPSTAVTPPPAPKVTTPAPKPPVKVSPPKAPSAPPVVKQVTKPATKPVTNVVNKTVPKATGTVKKTTGAVTKTVGQTTGTANKVAPKTTGTVKKTTGSTTKAVANTVGGVTRGGGGGGGVSGGGPSGPAGPLDRVLGAVGGTTGTTRNAVGTVGGSTVLGGSGTATTTLVRSADGTTYLVAPGGSAAGPGGGAGAGGFGGFGGPGATGGGGGTLAAMLAGASPKQLRMVLEHLEGCMPALPAIDRQVISMRAGVNGTPLTRPQIGARLGMSRETVRQTERRALNRLQYAAANTDCAGNLVGPFDVAGIGNLMPQLLFAGPVPVNMSSGSIAASTTDPFSAARGIVSRSAEPLFALNGGSGGGPAWAIILFTVLFSVAIAALTRELRSSF
jgi:hypothetical protein